MRTGYTGHVTPAEWRWAALVSGILLLAAFVPLIWAGLATHPGNDWLYVGVIHDYVDSATYLARMAQGAQGQVLTVILHSPEPQSATFQHILYAILGSTADLLALPTIATFHLARIAASLFMYMSLYQLASTIWTKVRTRRLFFVIVNVSAGFGWIAGPLTGDFNFLDLRWPEAFPFSSSLVNVHYPLIIGLLALLIGALVPVFRPGEVSDPDVANGGTIVFLSGLMVATVHPIAYVPLLMAFSISLAILWFRQRSITRRELRWLLWFAVPSLPILLYYVFVLNFNPLVRRVFLQQGDAAPPTLLALILSLGLPLIFALPGLFRAFRRLELDGDLMMLLWLLMLVLFIYVPAIGGPPAAIGISLPVAYFATRSLEDYWFRINRLNGRNRLRLMAALLPLMAASHLLVLWLPIQLLTSQNPEDSGGVLLPEDYLRAYTWLAGRVQSDDVVLAAPEVSLWLPVIIRTHVVYGHPIETADPGTKRGAVMAWYRGLSQDCDALLRGDYTIDGSYRIRYVLYGPAERQFGSTACLQNLDPAARFGSVEIYATGQDD
jgi:hypothetical protein